MVTDEQVRLLRRKLMEGKTVVAAAAASGMSEKTAHKWKSGAMPSARPERHWKTRKDPFESVWETDVLPLLQKDTAGRLEATELLRVLRDAHPGEFHEGQLRTLQRRLNLYRAHSGPEKEVFFEQVHPPGREGAFDFTSCSELGVTIEGQPFPHLLFHFILTFSRWQSVSLAFSETFEALLSGLQAALFALGGVPAVLRSDNLSAATHRLTGGGRELNQRYRQLLEHFGASSTRIEPGEAHQNGAIEQSHDTLKRRLEQRLILRGSRDFASQEAYFEGFVRPVARELNTERGVPERLAEEFPQLRPLPAQRLPEYTLFEPVTVRKWSTIHFAKTTYSVPSRLIGRKISVRQFAGHIEVWYQGALCESFPRARGESRCRIDYRHIVWSLAKKPGAMAHYRYREELFPTLRFRQTYDALCHWHGHRADAEYSRILLLAASTGESAVDARLALLLSSGERFGSDQLKLASMEVAVVVPDLPPYIPDVAEYDALLCARGEL